MITCLFLTFIFKYMFFIITGGQGSNYFPALGLHSITPPSPFSSDFGIPSLPLSSTCWMVLRWGSSFSCRLLLCPPPGASYTFLVALSSLGFQGMQGGAKVGLQW